MCPGKRREYGLDDVRDIHEVTLVAAIAEQGDRLAPFPAAEEDGDHAALEIGALAWTVDVRKPKGHRPKVGQFDELFRRSLESAVVRLRIDRDVLVGTDWRFAVDRPTGGDIHDDRRAEPSRGLDHVPRPADDHALVEVLLRHRFDDLGLRSAMHDRIDPSAAELALKRREVGNIGDAQFGARIEVRAISRREIVHYHDVVAAFEERIHHMAAEESRAAGHKNMQDSAETTQ